MHKFEAGGYHSQWLRDCYTLILRFFAHRILDHLERAGFKKQLSIPDVRRALICHQVVQIPQEFTPSGSFE